MANTKATTGEIDLALPAASAIALGATSYDFNKLHDGAVHAATLKSQDGRDNALAKAEKDARLAEMPGERTPLPPGTVLAEVDDANGTTVKAPVNDPENPTADPAADNNPTDAG